MSKKLLLIFILSALWLFLIYLFAGRVEGSELKEASYEDLFLKAPQTRYLPYRYSISTSIEKPYLEAKLIAYSDSYWIKDLILSNAGKNDISADLFLKIAECESRLNPKAKNPISSASGVFQFLNSTFNRMKKELGRDMDVFNPVHNVEAAAYLFTKEGTKPWLSSYECWKDAL